MTAHDLVTGWGAGAGFKGAVTEATGTITK